MPLGFPKPSWGKWELRDMAIDDVTPDPERGRRLLLLQPNHLCRQGALERELGRPVRFQPQTVEVDFLLQ